MREEFEKLPKIKEKVKFLLFLDGGYECISYDYIDLENFVNGAWYAWQEQKKKINKVIEHLDSVEGLVWYEEVKELLK